MDGGGAWRGQVGDQVGNLMGFGRTADWDSAEAVQHGLPRFVDRAAIGRLQPPEQMV
jgi:hypothetical protein